MAAHLSFLLILTGLTGIDSISTVSEVSVKAGKSITIPCLSGSQYRNHVKYLCKGYYWSSCSFAVKTNQRNSGKFSISDDKNQRIFTVTIRDLTDKDTDYWCAAEINGGSDVGEYFHLSVTRGTPSLHVDHQEISAFEGGKLTINCYHRNSGEMKWCRLGSSCVTESSGSIDGTRVTIDKRDGVFTVTMSGLRTESSGWYLCVRGVFQMPVNVTVTEKPTTRIDSITTVSNVSAKAGDSITIPCLYGSQYRNNVKYLCKGYYWSSCSYAVKTNQRNSGKFSISDDKNKRIFTVTIKDLTEGDTDYWCAVEINGGSDVGKYFHLPVTRGTPSLHVDHQEISAFEGGNVTISCYHRNSGEMKWCRLGSSCVTGSSGSIDGTRVTIDKRDSVFTVTMSGLKTESSGWYLCVKGDLQMPVHLSINVTHTSVFASEAPPDLDGSLSSSLKSLLIRLSLLIAFVMVNLFIWFMFKRYKMTKAESSDTTTAEVEVRYSNTEYMGKTSGEASHVA